MFTNGNKSIIKAYEKLNKLKPYERLGVITIILEHWESELLIDNDNEPIIPQSIGIDNIYAIATKLLFASLQLQSKISLISKDILEANIQTNKAMEKCMSLYYKLNSSEKLDYLVNVFMSFENDKLFNSNDNLKELKEAIDFYELATDIHNWNKATDL